MPFLCSREPSTSEHTAVRISRGWKKNQPLLPAFPGWNVWHTQPSQNNLNERKPDEPIVLLDGYLSNRTRLRESIPEHVEDTISDATLIGRYMAQAPRGGLGNLKGNLFVCALSPETDGIAFFRDRLGGRTGYWHHTDTLSVVGTHAAEVARFCQSKFIPDPKFIAACFRLSGRLPVSRSAFAGVHELIPGETVFLAGGKVKRAQKQALERSAPVPTNPEEQASEFRRLLTLSIQNALRHEQGIASMVSGGLDSAPMTVIADQLLHQTSRSILPVSWHLPDCRQSDERHWVEMLEPCLQQPIQFFDGSTLSPFESIDCNQVSQEAPLWNPCRSLIERCYEIAAERGCGVILNGNAGDLLYPDRSWLFLDTLRRSGAGAVLKDISWIVRHYGWHTAWRDPALRRLLARKLGLDAIRRIKVESHSKTVPWLTTSAQNHLTEETWPPDTESFGFPEYFRKVFGQAMAFGRAHEQPYALKYGLERRDPYQDEELAALMLALPFSASHFQDQNKHIARLAARDLIPTPLQRKRRTGNLTPLISMGLKKHHADIKRRLDKQDHWKEWVRPEAVGQALANPKPTGHQQLLISQCLGYILWLEKHVN